LDCKKDKKPKQKKKEEDEEEIELNYASHPNVSKPNES
jgi:hypothetical protein